MMKVFKKRGEVIQVVRQRNLTLYLFLTALLLVLVPNTVQSQSSDMLAHNELLIRNGTDGQITFFIRKGDDDWKEKKLGPRDSSIYKDIDQIWIRGNQRRLELQRRYKIVWEGGAFHIKEIVLR